MEIADNLYYSAFINKRKQEKYLKRILNKKNIKDIHILIYRLNNINLLELVDTVELFKLDLREDDIYVVGMFESKKEAYEYISKITLNTINNFQEINKKTLFKEINCEQ